MMVPGGDGDGDVTRLCCGQVVNQGGHPTQDGQCIPPSSSPIRNIDRAVGGRLSDTTTDYASP